MRQGVLSGRTTGLRPAERRRLERLCHRRHPSEAMADPLTLQRLADEARSLELPLSLVIDARGLCRVLWVGELESAGRLRECLGSGERRTGGDLRLITCRGSGRHPQLQPGPSEALVALDLKPELWLRYGHEAGSGGRWPALLLRRGDGATPWHEEEKGELLTLCERDPLPPEPSSIPASGMEPTGGAERVLLLCLSGADPAQARREVAELEGLVRSAGGEPVGVVEQRRSQLTPHTIWGEGKLAEAALEARRLGATLVVT
ncbi:MAG: GTPase HflX, partial [Cyanobium sp.]